MKGTEHFTRTIAEYLNQRAMTDPLFAPNLMKPNKNIEECITYILNEVQKSGCNGFDDDFHDIAPTTLFSALLSDRRAEMNIVEVKPNLYCLCKIGIILLFTMFTNCCFSNFRSTYASIINLFKYFLSKSGI